MKHQIALFITALFSLLMLLSTSIPLLAAEDSNTEYVSIDPIIVTNYKSKSKKKLGFIQLSAQLTVSNSEKATKLNTHMPLVRDYIVEFLNFSDEQLIKDVTKRKTFRKDLAKGIQKMLTEEIGEPLIDELIITRYMWN